MTWNALDNDLYKLTMQQAVLKLFPEATAEYRFKNRGEHRFNRAFCKALQNELLSLQFDRTNCFSPGDLNWLEQLGLFDISYLHYLSGYRFDPSQISINLLDSGQIDIKIKGPWVETILWEVPLMALISELYFKIVAPKWSEPVEECFQKAQAKGQKLAANNCVFADFGTRRRRSAAIHELVVRGLKDSETFVGTSNLYLAKTQGLKPIGTMAHEWVQANAVLESMNHANYFALSNWVRVYNADLGIALTDTFGTNAFLENFNLRFSKLYDGVRHDSGDPFEFVDKIVNHYKNLDINPNHKTIIFSDGLNIDKTIEIRKYCDGKINCSFGIGTHFTNDVDSVLDNAENGNHANSDPLNIVIKLWKLNDIPVVKLSDTEGKENGEKKAVEIYKWIYGR
jgi:nicotinate phosphoribosyltransferase